MSDAVIELIPSMILGRISVVEKEPLESFEEELEVDLDIAEVISNTEVSPSVRAICEAEMLSGQKRGWKL